MITPKEHDELFVWIKMGIKLYIKKISRTELIFLTIKIIQKQSPGIVL